MDNIQEQNKRKLSIFIPALNEEELISETVNEVLATGRQILEEFEILIFNDGSTDRTKEIIDSLAQSNPEIRTFHSEDNRGLGYIFRQSIQNARYETLVGFPGDHAFSIDGIRKVFEAVGEADIIIGYRTNQGQVRSTLRKILSALYTGAANMMAGRAIKDIHGIPALPVQHLRQTELRLYGAGSNMEIIIKLLRKGATLKEVPVTLNMEERSQALSFNSFKNVLRTFIHLLFQMFRR